jgi:glyoxalase family protein
MQSQIQGIHHITSLASSPAANNRFFTEALGLRRVKTTVNFDAPEVYHLYYGDEIGTPGTVMTYFPRPRSARGKPGVGEVGTVSFVIPVGTSEAWKIRLAEFRVGGITTDTLFGENRVLFGGPDGESFALVEREDTRAPWTGGGVSEDMAIRGFHSASMRLRDGGASAELLRFMGYEAVGSEGATMRFAKSKGNNANHLDIETVAGGKRAKQGAGSVHHIAFSVADAAAQRKVRKALIETGYQVTPQIDRDYFQAIYFRSPGGILFEIATDAPGFDADEDRASLGSALKLPKQHEHLRAELEAEREPLD